MGSAVLSLLLQWFTPNNTINNRVVGQSEEITRFLSINTTAIKSYYNLIMLDNIYKFVLNLL